MVDFLDSVKIPTWLIDYCLTSSEQYFSYIQDQVHQYKKKTTYMYEGGMGHPKYKLYKEQWNDQLSYTQWKSAYTEPLLVDTIT